MIIALTPSCHVPAVWPAVWPMLAPAVERSARKPDVFAALIDKRADLWAIVEDGKPVAAVVTQLQNEPERRCLLWMVGGSRIAEWVADFMAALVARARAAGCVSVVGVGRRGWRRIARQFGCESIAPIDGDPAWRMAI